MEAIVNMTKRCVASHQGRQATCSAVAIPPNAGPPRWGVCCKALPTQVADDELERICSVVDIEPEQIRGHSKEPHIVAARWAWWVLLRERNLSFSAIARFADRDHSSVMYGLRRAPECQRTQEVVTAARGA